MKTIVSVTMLAVERDSRTFRHAASFARFGYNSIVVEGEPSGLDRKQLPFRLITIEGAASPFETAARTPSSGAAEPGAAPPMPAAETIEPAHPRAAQAPAPIGRVLHTLGKAGLRFSSWRSERRLPLLLRRSFRDDNERALASLPPADLYYLHFFWQYPAVHDAAKRHGARYVYDAHDAYWDWDSYKWYPRAFAWYLRAVERRCVRSSAAFVTVSDGVADLLERRYRRRPAVVRNLHDLRLDERRGTDVRRAAAIGDDGFLLVLVGNEKPGDAIAETLAALTELPEHVHLAFLGRGYEKHEQLVRELGLVERVHLVPPVAPTQVTVSISGADAGLVLYRNQEKNYLHSLPNRFFHSVAAGLPIIYPPLPEITALAEQHGLGLEIDPGSPASIAAAVRTLSEDPAAAGRYRSNVERAREVLNWEQEEQRLGEVVAATLGDLEAWSS